MDKETEDLYEHIANEVFKHYVKSSDYNGISLTNLMQQLNLDANKMKDALIGMLREEYKEVTLTFSSVTINPYIKAFPDLPFEKQIDLLKTESTNGICVYPSPHFLEQFLDSGRRNDYPYSKRLFHGEPQFQPEYFDLSVLERFMNDPRYEVHNDDYSGNIYVPSQYEDQLQEKDKISLQTFGLAYNEHSERCIVVYLRYLSKLSPELQQYWKRHEYGGKCKQNADYLRNTLGEWAENVSVFIAFLEELYHIRKMTEEIGKPSLFRDDFRQNRPKEFAIFLRPTLKNYQSFIHSLDKMLSENINKEFFKGELELEEDIERPDGRMD